ncbi:MAG: hypothetical protein IKC94_00155 [Lentisphaeria bacterium]|nr:hypothetical protein [Lentisphaeria bacterium]
MLAGIFTVSAGVMPAVQVKWHNGQSIPENVPQLILKNTRLAPGGALAMNGETSEIAVKDSGNWNVAAAATLHGVFRIAPPENSTPENAGHDAFFYKHNQLFLGVIGEKIYFNFFNGSAWVGALYGNISFKPEPDRFYSFTLTVKVHRDIAQGELWTDVEIYLDGACIAQKRFDQLAPAESSAPLEIGCATGFGEVWHLGGEVGGVQLYRRILAESEIRQLVTADDRVTPAFDVPRQLPDGLNEELARIEASAIPEIRAGASIIRNWVLAGGDAGNAVTLCRQLYGKKELPQTLGGGTLEIFKLGDSILTVCRRPRAGIVSWYDLRANREMWHYAGKLWSVKIKHGSTATVSSATDPGVNTQLVSVERSTDNVTFVFSTNAVWGIGEVRGVFDGKRLEMQLHTVSEPGFIIDTVTFPAFVLQPFRQGRDDLLVPCMSGRVIENAVENRASYSSDYPRGYCSMQLGAYYDAAGGVYFSSEDPTGQMKKLDFLTGSSGLSVAYTFFPGWQYGKDHNEFTTSNCALELFRGNWYQAGLIYRRNLEKTSPVWWSAEQPRRSIPQWMQNNLIWVRFEDRKLDDALKLQEFIGEPLALHWYLWNGQTFDRDYPFFPPSPFTVEILGQARAAGMRVVPYVNGRIWEVKDFRDEIRATDSLGRPNFVTGENGQPVLERGVVSYHVLCFATPFSRDHLLGEMTRLIDMGCDGIYIDQVAAAAGKRCYNPGHRHDIAAGDVWFRHGHLPLLQQARARWAASGHRETVITSEDNSEIYAGHIDGLLGWRWMYDGQVPLFMLIYSGRTQLVGLDYSNELGNGIYAKLATQLIWGEQLGWFMMSYITSPYQHNFRLFLRRTALCRKAMLDFFNRGMMLEVPQFTQSVPDIRARWGMHGTQYLHTPPVVSSRWKWNNIESFILANTTESIQKNCLKLDLPEKARYKLYVFNGNGKFETLEPGIYREKSFELDPLQLMLILAVPENEDASITVENIRREFARIAESENIPDPFAPRMDYSAPGPVTPAGQWHDGTKALSVEGGRVEFQRNFVSHCNECVIDFGTIDFGETAPAELEAEFALPGHLAGGKVVFMLDHPVNGTVLAERILDQGSGSWSNFRAYRFPVLHPVTGQRKVFIRIGGIFLCNFKRWRAL